jgi:hypothetical protein
MMPTVISAMWVDVPVPDTCPAVGSKVTMVTRVAIVTTVVVLVDVAGTGLLRHSSLQHAKFEQVSDQHAP